MLSDAARCGLGCYPHGVDRVALIVNPIAGRGRGREAAGVAREVLVGGGLEVSEHVTSAAGEAPQVIRELGSEVDAIVGVGGDGTLREVAEGTAERDVTVGLIPMGTANVVARDLSIPFAPRKAARVVLAGGVRSLDVGRVNDRLFLAMVGIGFDGEVVRRVTEKRERSGAISQLSYIGPTVRTLLKNRSVPLEVKVDGADGAAGFGVVVCNTRNYAGHFVMTPAADPSDRSLDFMLQKSRSRLTLTRLFVASCLRRETSRRIAAYGRGSEFVIDAEQEVAFQADGDHLGQARTIRISLLEKPVRIFAPNGARAPRTSPEGTPPEC